MRKKHKKLAITFLLAFGLFINLSSNIHADVKNPSITLGTLSNETNNDPIIGDH